MVDGMPYTDEFFLKESEKLAHELVMMNEELDMETMTQVPEDDEVADADEIDEWLVEYYDEDLESDEWNRTWS